MELCILNHTYGAKKLILILQAPCHCTIKKDIKDFENLLSELVVIGSTVNLALGTDVGISCRRDQDELDNIIDYEEFYGEIIELKLERGCVIVADDDTGHEYHAKIEDLFST